MPSTRVLVSGAGVAGSITAFWLAKHGFEVVVVERAHSDQKLGQGIEIEEPALTVVREMGILNTLKTRRTGEKGFILEDAQSRSWAKLEAGGTSPTGALEIMRGDLCEILQEAANKFPNVTYHFETTIKCLSQTPDQVTVELENRSTKAITSGTFDFVIAADGQRSRTRNLVMGTPEQINCYKPVGAYVSYFSIPKEDQDWPYSRLCHFPGRRIVWKRPISADSDMTSVYLIHLPKKDIPSLQQANATGDRPKQKEEFAKIFSDAGWEMPNVLSKMMDAENFYSDELTQVKLSTWSQGRVVLVGDAAWAPTPFTGEGNQLAIIGAWVLAQELSRDRSTAAFEKYEARLRNYVERAQQIPLGGWMPYIACPQTSIGILTFRVVLSLIAWGVRMFGKKKSGDTIDLEQDGDKHHEPFDLQVEKM